MNLKSMTGTTILLLIALGHPALAAVPKADLPIVVSSPDGRVKAEIASADHLLCYHIKVDGKQMLGLSRLGIKSDDIELGQDVVLGTPRTHKLYEQYRFFGAHSVAVNRANEAEIPAQSHGESYLVDVHVRMTALPYA